nr:hypothetical protein [Escherichia coli]
MWLFLPVNCTWWIVDRVLIGMAITKFLLHEIFNKLYPLFTCQFSR